MSSILDVERQVLVDVLERITLLIKERSQADEEVGRVSYKEKRLYCKTDDTRATIEADFLEGLDDFCVEGMDLLRYLQRVTEETVTLEKTDKLIVKAKQGKASFALYESFTFPIPGKWSPIGKNFLETLGEASRFVSKSFHRPVLTTVCVTDNKMKSADGLLYYETQGEERFLKEESVLIPGASVPFIKLLAPDQFHITDNIMYFKQKPTLIGACCLFGGEYPAGEKLQSDYKTGKQIQFHEKTKEAVSRCSVFVENSRFEEEKKIFITLKKQRALLNVHSTIGSNKETVPVKYPEELEGTAFCLRPDFFIEVLNKNTTFLLCNKSIQIKNDSMWFASALINRS